MTYLNHADATLLDQHPSVVLHKSQSCWVPWGHFPLMVGVSPTEITESRKKKARVALKDIEKVGHTAVALLPCLDVNCGNGPKS